MAEETEKDSGVTNGEFWATLLSLISQQTWAATGTGHKQALWMTIISFTMAKSSDALSKRYKDRCQDQTQKMQQCKRFSKSLRKFETILFYNIALYIFHKACITQQFSNTSQLISASETTSPMLFTLFLQKLVGKTCNKHWFSKFLLLHLLAMPHGCNTCAAAQWTGAELLWATTTTK